jgi:hypothetical protein
VERQQAANGRWYLSDGVWLPSVTTILSVYPKGHQFERWLGESNSYDDAIAKRDAAGDRGTLVHDSIAALIEGQTVELPEDTDPKVGKLIQGFLNFWREMTPVTILSETMLVGNGYAGCCDWIGTIGGELWLLDFKTSGAIYTSYHLQTAAYQKAAEYRKEAVWGIERRGCLWLKTNTKKGWQIVESDNPHADWSAFVACKEIFHYENGYEPIPFKEKESRTVFSLLEEA